MAVKINDQLKNIKQSAAKAQQPTTGTAQKKQIFSAAKSIAQSAPATKKQSSTAYQRMTQIGAGQTQAKNTGWQYRPDGTRKTFDELTTPEVLTWIGTLPENERAGAARDFETNYLKNPGSTRYDPYYTDYSNNDAARALFGVNTFDQKWIDENRGYANYLTFTAENYTSPKKPGKNASAQEKAAYEWWQIANTYEATTQAAESEYAQLRQEIQEMAQVARRAGDSLTTDEILAGIDWGEYKTLKNLREASAAGNGRYLNRPVQVGDASLRSMVNAALRGENVADARDFVYGESQYLRGAGQRDALQEAYGAKIKKTAFAPASSDVGSNNQAARELFGVEVFDQDWIENNKGLMAYVKFKDEDDTEPVKPDEDADEREKAAYEYWKIAHTYEDTTRNAEKELEELRSWMEKKAGRLGEGATAEQLIGMIDWEDKDWQKEYPTLTNMREVEAAGNQRMVNRPVSASDKSLLEMAESIFKPAAAEDKTEADEDLVAEKPENVTVSEEMQAPAEALPDRTPSTPGAPKTTAELVAENTSEYGRTAAKSMLKQTLDFLNDMDAQGKLSEEQKAQRDEWQAEYDKLLDEEAEREIIEERVEAEARETSVDKVVAPLRFLWNRGWMDALRDGEFVPLEDYEDFLRYRALPAAENAEAMSKYDRYSAAGERTSLMAEGVATGLDKAATASTKGLEYVLYTLARFAPPTQGMTKDEIYASDSFLAALKGWNEQYDKQYIDEETKAELTEEYPVVSLVSEGVSELLKMTAQAGGVFPSVPRGGMDSAMQYGFGVLQQAGIYGQAVTKWDKAMQTVGRLGEIAVAAMPFALDVYGSTYETAIGEGATENQAAGAAALNGLFTGSISNWITGRLTKLGGNITRIFRSRAGQTAAQQGAIAVAKNGSINAVLGIGKQLLEAAVEEGFEEAIEEPIQSAIAKGVYDHGRAWTGEGGVFDARAMMESGIGGAVAGSMFTITAGASGLLGKPAKTAADRIIEKAENGEKISQSEIDELEKIESREAAIQDRTEELTAADTSAIDAAKAKAEAAAEAVKKAESNMQEADRLKQDARAQAQPTINGLNDGTKSYGDKSTVDEVIAAGERMKNAQANADKMAAALDEARNQHADMIQAQQEAEQRTQAAARAQATAEIDAEIREEETQTLAEQKNEPEKPGVKWLARKERNVLSADQRQQLNILDALGKEYGVEIDILDTLGPGKNGRYAGGRKIAIGLDATENAYVQVGIHEMVHYIRGMDKDAYTVLEEAVLSRAAEDEDYFDLDALVKQRIAEYKGTQELTEEAAREEIVAELVPQVLTNEDSARLLVEKNRTLAQKIRDFFINFATKLKSIAERYAAASGHGEIFSISENVDGLMEIANVLDEALNFVKEADGKEAPGDERQKSPVQPPEKIERSPEFDDWFGKSVIVNPDGSPKLVYHQTDDLADDKDTPDGMLFKDSVRHIAGREGEQPANYLKIENPLRFPDYFEAEEWYRKNVPGYGKLYAEYSRALSKHRNKVEKMEKRRRTARKAGNTEEVDRIDDLISKTGQDFRVQVTDSYTARLKKILNDFFLTGKSGYDGIVIDNEETGIASEFIVFDSSQIKSATDNTVKEAESGGQTEKLSSDAERTKAFERWFGKSKIVNEDGSPKMMYHGSTASFTVFDKKKARSSGLYGKGFYFTNSDTHAGQYGNLYQVYLKVENPLTPGGSTVTRAQVKKFLEAIVENEDDYSIENYGTYDVGEILKKVYRKDAFALIQDINATAIGDFVEAVKLFNEVNGTEYDGIVVPTETVVFEPTQIKSATDNIGTYDPENPDIRYSLKSPEETAQLIEETRTEEKTEALNRADRIADRTVRAYKSTIERSEVSIGIDQMIGSYQAHDDARATAIADQLARDIIEKSLATSTSHREGYEETRRRLLKEGFSLTDTQKQEVANRFGSYNIWRKSLMGSINAKNGATSLDAIWGELSGMHPEYFPADANEAQMPEYIERFVQAMKPTYENPYGMNMEAAAADLSMRLQADVQEALGGKDRIERAERLRNDSESYREQMRVQSEERRRKAQERRTEQFKEVAQKIEEAREAGDDEGIKRALVDYRKLTGRKSHAADAIDMGIEARRLRAEVRRLTSMIDNLSEMIQAEETDFDRKKLSDQQESYIELRDQMQRSADALHRQEVLERAGIPDDETPPEAEALLAGEMQRRMDEDMEETIFHRVEEMRGRVENLWSQMKTRMKDFGMISTIPKEELAATFADLEGELVKHSELAKMWENRKNNYKAQKDAEVNEESYLKQDLDSARARGDKEAVYTLQDLLLDARDRMDALDSQIRNAEAQEKYCRRLGAESLEKALSEGRLPEPIMERVIALCKDAGRRGAFNQNILVKSVEAIRLNSTTAARVYDDLFGDAAPLMRAIYYDPVMDNETDRQRWIKQWRDRISALKLTKEQSALVQEIGEGRLNPQDARYQQADQIVHDAVKVFREFYDEAHAMASRALERNGYERPGRITDYFPHIETQKSWWDKLGIPLDNTSLPTSINGLTDTFTPGKQYSSHLEHRYGEKTDYDALYGFEQYIGGMSNVIFHTDDIQRHRQLETEIRTAAKRGQFDGGQRSEHLSEFVKWIHEYTNLLAGKKAWLDRPFEGTLGRAIYSAATRFKGMKGASAVGGNLASAVTNMIPVTQVMAEAPIGTVLGIIQMCKGISNGRNGVPESQYKIRKLGSDSVVQTMYTRFNHFASKPFALVDLFATNVVVNAYYQENLRKGMDSETAMRSADSKAARLMGDRSKGAMPNIYGSQIAGFLTQFQMEVANQSQHFRKDIWRSGGGFKKAMITLLASAFAGYIWNEINEQLTGRRPAADPIQMGLDIYQTWKNDGSPMEIAQAAYNSMSEMMPYSNIGGRVAAFDGVTGFIEALTTEGNDGNDVRYALTQLMYGVLPAGGQLKKSVTGIKAQIDDGYYNASGTKLKYALPDWRDDPLTAAQMILFGPSSTKEAQAYYGDAPGIAEYARAANAAMDGNGWTAPEIKEAPGLTESQTKDYEQARERGATSTEAYENEAKKAAAQKLESEASKTENAIEDAEAKARSGQEAPEIDAGQIDEQRAEAAELRTEAVPGDELTDFWWARKDTPEVKTGIEIWQKTGKTWALPHSYTEDTSFMIKPAGEDKSRKEYLDAELVKEAEEMYEEGYMEIMAGVQADKLDEEELEELESMLEDLKADVNAAMKKRIKERNEG